LDPIDSGEFLPILSKVGRKGHADALGRWGQLVFRSQTAAFARARRDQ
jgi:hypothetical protein